jgi:hypothetical protein
MRIYRTLRHNNFLVSRKNDTKTQIKCSKIKLLYLLAPSLFLLNRAKCSACADKFPTCYATLIWLMMKPLHIHTRAQNHPDKQKSHKSRYMSRIGGCSPALAAKCMSNFLQVEALKWKQYKRVIEIWRLFWWLWSEHF